MLLISYYSERTACSRRRKVVDDVREEQKEYGVYAYMELYRTFVRHTRSDVPPEVLPL